MRQPFTSCERFPHPKCFSDPAYDFEGVEAELQAIVAKPLPAVTAHDLFYAFNSYLPAGTCEEMAFYVPRAFKLLREDSVEYGIRSELMECLVIWVHVEWQALQAYPEFLQDIRTSCEALFEEWTADTHVPADMEDRCLCLESLLYPAFGSFLEADSHYPRIPWLRPEYHLAKLLPADSLPRAAWLLWVYHWLEEDCCSMKRAHWEFFHLPKAELHRAADMLDDWLLTSATPQESEFWEPIATACRTHLSYSPC